MKSTQTGAVTEADTKRHLSHQFEIPSGVTRLHIGLDYSPVQPEDSDYSNQISLSVFDPERFRGARHNNPDQNVVLTPDSASPGYLPGPISAGVWSVYLDVHRVVGATPVEYRLSVETDDGCGWYRGDIHAHTYHSDGRWGPRDLVDYAVARGHDFVTVTDHNTVSAHQELCVACEGRIVPLRGMELTTFYGHALALGIDTWHEWRVDAPDPATMPELCSRIINAGGFFVIAHPMIPGDPKCTGCDWLYEGMDPGNAHAVEVWNRHWAAYNEQGLQLAYRWLNAGHRLVLTAGSDAHFKTADTDNAGNSRALMVIYAEGRSESAILAGMRAGHAYLSAGPEMEFFAKDDAGTIYRMGDTVPRGTSVYVHVRLQSGTDTDSFHMIERGEEHYCDRIGFAVTWGTQFLRNEPSWLLVEIRDKDNRLRAITNPLFF